MSLYAQYGYGKSSKIEKAIENGSISGAILSPKAETPEKVENYIKKLSSDYSAAEILFDPQFFICPIQGNVNFGKLDKYPYYAENITRSSLSNPSNIQYYTKNVLEYQHKLNISTYISPTIIIDDFNGRESQISISLAYEAINFVASTNDLLISFVIHESAFRNKEAMEEFLNTISLLDVKGFYLIIEREKTANFACLDANILSNIMQFIYILSEINQYSVMVGYSDLISIPLSIVSGVDFACGWFSNLKSFSEANYRPSTGGRRPRSRYTSGELMNALLLNPEISTLNSSNYTNKVLSESPFNSCVFPTLNEGMWTDEVSCLHNWYVLNNLVKQIASSGNIAERLDFVFKKITTAKDLYSEFYSILPDIDTKSKEGHLSMWEEAMHLFRNGLGV